MTAPAYPLDLNGHGQVLLDYLPTYVHQSTHIREVLDAQGFEITDLWAYAQDDWPLLTDPRRAPVWALTIWEAVFGVGNTVDPLGLNPEYRRERIMGWLRPAVTEADIKDFVLSQFHPDVLVALGDRDLWVTITPDGVADYTLEVAFPWPFSPAPVDVNNVEILTQLRRVLPAHIAFTYADQAPPP